MGETIKAIIVEDEVNGRATLRKMLEKFCDGVDVLAEAANIEQAIKAINSHQPELVFLDIEMPKGNGFEIFDHFEEPAFKIIFTTAYSQYAIKAIRITTLDYLLKPIDLNELRASLQRFRDERDSGNVVILPEQRRMAVASLGNSISKIALPIKEGFVFVDIEDVIRCEADGSYTLFVIQGREMLVVSRNLKEYEDLLSEHDFVRVHRSHLINKKHIKGMIRNKTAAIIMNDNAHIPLSANKKDDFFKNILT